MWPEESGEEPWKDEAQTGTCRYKWGKIHSESIVETVCRKCDEQ